MANGQNVTRGGSVKSPSTAKASALWLDNLSSRHIKSQALIAQRIEYYWPSYGVSQIYSYQV